jgi:hypothetical protein
VTGFTAVLDAINDLTKAIDDLDTQRSGLTGQLEYLAHRWDERYPQPMMTPGHQHRLVCSRCHFRYMDTTETVVRFGTDCSWCGRDAGTGVEIQRTWFERQLQDDEVTTS